MSVGVLHYTQPQVYKAQKALIACKFNGLKMDAKIFDAEKDAKKCDFLAKNPAGKVPFLQTDMGCIFTSMSIARYAARCRADTSLYGRSFLDEGLIDTWMDFCTHEIEVPLMSWVYPVMGLMADVPTATAQAKEDVKKALGELEQALKSSPFLMGQEVSLADIVIVCSLREGFVRVFDPAYRKGFPNTAKWFENCCAMPQFKAVLGDVVLCSKAEAPKPFNPSAAKKAEVKAASPKQQAAKKSAAAPAAAAAAAPAAGGAANEAAVKATGDQIRDLKAKLKGEGMSGGQINKHADVAALVTKLAALKSGGGGSAAAPAKSSPKAAPAAAPASAGGDDAITAVGNQIRDLKAKLKGEGMSGGQINKHADVTALVAKLQELKAGGGGAVPVSAAKSPKGSPKQAPAAAPAAAGGSIAEQVEKVGGEIRALKEKLKAEGMSGGQMNKDDRVKSLVARLGELKKQL